MPILQDLSGSSDTSYHHSTKSVIALYGLCIDALSSGSPHPHSLVNVSSGQSITVNEQSYNEENANLQKLLVSLRMLLGGNLLGPTVLNKVKRKEY
jgi:hypothetical protein